MKDRLNAKLKLQGQIEVILEDVNGNVKHREIKNNTITRPALKYFLYQMMQASNISNLTRISTGQADGVAPTSFGIYAMRSLVNIERDEFRPPFVDNTMLALHPDVTFFNVNGATTQSYSVMIPVDTKCHMDKGDEVVYAIEYMKSTGTGTVQSVVIGRAYDTEGQYIIYSRDPELPIDVYTTPATHYLLEHTANGTILHKAKSTANQSYSVNFKTKDFTQYTVAARYTNLTAQFGGLIVNNTIFKATKLSSGTSGSNYNVLLTYVRNWTRATVAETLTIPFTARPGMSINGTVLPLLVPVPGENKLIIFLTTSLGDHGDAGMGANIQKAIVDVSDLNNITWEFEDMGVLPYAISNHGTSVGLHATGYFDGEKYYLPFYYRIAQDGSFDTTAATAMMEGIVISSDFEMIHKTVCFRPANNVLAAFVQSDEIAQCTVNTNNPRYVDASQILSGTSLAAPVTKRESDTLRIIYRYKLS